MTRHLLEQFRRVMLDDWRITHADMDLPPEVWSCIRRERLFGLVIPTRYGGLGFSPLAHSEIVMKLASRSITAAVTLMVPTAWGRPICCCAMACRPSATAGCRA